MTDRAIGSFGTRIFGAETLKPASESGSLRLNRVLRHFPVFLEILCTCIAMVRRTAEEGDQVRYSYIAPRTEFAA